MKKLPKLLTFLFCIFCFLSVLESKEPRELENLENLIRLTEKNLKELQSLKASILEYQQLQSQFLDQPNRQELLMKTGKSSKKILEDIKEMHLSHAFDAKFLSELALFAKMTKKPFLLKN